MLAKPKMTFFNYSVPPLCRKPSNVNFEQFPGAWRIHFQLGKNVFYSTFYTRLDQACILWSVISVVIFTTAQFFALSWTIQAVLWTMLTLFGIWATVDLTYIWLNQEQLKFVLYAWITVMLGGVLLTDLSIFLGWGEVLIRLCPLWLGLSGLGYILTGLGMRSRTFILASLINFLGILILPYLAPWQFLTTGLIIGSSTFLLAEFQWDTTASCEGHSLDSR
jgi:hypothetical protein